MTRRLSAIAPDWWDYTTLPPDLIEAAARLTPRDLEKLSRPGFKVLLYDTLEEFYLAEALEYVEGLAPEHGRTTPWASAARSGRPNSYPWRRASSMRWVWMRGRGIFGGWMNGAWMAKRCR